MLTDDLPQKMLNTAPGDCVWVPFSGPTLTEMLRLARRKGWEYRPEPHGVGSLLTCTESPLGERHAQE